MIKKKSQIPVLGALAITILLNFPRLFFALNRDETVVSLGLTVEDVLVRTIFLFCFSWFILSFNLFWKDRLIPERSFKRTILGIAVNLFAFIFTVALLTSVRTTFVSTILDDRQLFGVSFMNYLIVLVALLLFGRMTTLSFQQQQDLLEKEQAKQKALQHQMEVLRNQINPHFLFNALDSLTALIRQQSDHALPFVNQLSRLLRSTLQRSAEDFISIADELEYLESYIYLQKERFGAKFQVDIRIPNDWKTQLIPSFSLQLLAENAIKHNIISKKQPLLIEIYAEQIYLVIRNPLQKRRDVKGSTETGLANLSARFKLLKKQTIQIQQEEQYFIVKLPILEHESYPN